MFNNANHFTISGGTYNVTNAGQRGIDLVKQGIAPGAFHNSDERYDAPKCHPRTRLAVIKTITTSINDRQKTSFIMWLYGPAGTGKSSIAQTIALQVENLAASFFWSRSAPGRNDEKRLVASLAYQLIIAIPRMETYVEEAIRKDPALLSRSLEAQMTSLVVEPLQKAFRNQEGPTGDIGKSRLIILDGLDECGTPRAQRYILDVLSAVIGSHSFPIPIIFLIASRPEQEIRDSFNAHPLLSITTRLALDDLYHPDDDIRLFLVEEFDSLKTTHILGQHLPPTWPTGEIINTLVQKSSGQFIYAATVVKFVKSPRSRPEDQLDMVLGITETGKHTPFAELDALYTHIFSLVEDLPRAFEILSCFFLVRYTGVTQENLFTSRFFEQILSYKVGDFHLILSDLHSILDVPHITAGRGVLRVFHASLRDFLMDPNRSGKFYMDQGQAHARLTQCFLRYIHNLEGQINSGLRMGVGINLRLGEHCLNSYPTQGLLQEFFNFNLENWIELLSSGSVVEWYCYEEIFRLTSWFQKQEPAVREHFGTEESLYKHHYPSRRRAIDSQCSRMVPQFHATEIAKEKITALTHPHVLHGMDFSAIFNMLSNKINDPRTADHEVARFNILLPGAISMSSGSPTRDAIFEFQEFVCDPERARNYFVHGGMYTDFSLKITESVFEKKDSEDLESQRLQAIPTAIECLPFFLSKAKYKPKLAESLLSWYTLSKDDTPDLDINTRLLHEAIDLYRKKETRTNALPIIKPEGIMGANEVRSGAPATLERRTNSGIDLATLADGARSDTPTIFNTMPGQREKLTGFRNTSRKIGKRVAAFFN